MVRGKQGIPRLVRRWEEEATIGRQIRAVESAQRSELARERGQCKARVKGDCTRGAFDRPRTDDGSDERAQPQHSPQHRQRPPFEPRPPQRPAAAGARAAAGGERQLRRRGQQDESEKMLRLPYPRAVDGLALERGAARGHSVACSRILNSFFEHNLLGG